MAEIRIISTQAAKPSSQELHLLKPFKLSFLDQITPEMYVPIVFFYTQTHSSFNSSCTTDQLKSSLSETLNHFYPISGRARNNLFIDSYYEGVQFMEARVDSCCLSDYLQRVRIIEEMNQLLPCQPFCHVPDQTTPLLAVQVTTFSCGGIAVGVCVSHKIFDGVTTYAFLRVWSNFCRGGSNNNGKLIIPRHDDDLFTALSQLFPPAQTPPNASSSTNKRTWFNEGRWRTRTFVFDEMSINSLKSLVKSKNVEHPTRSQALTSFIWKYATLASGISNTSVCLNVANIRQKLEPQLPDYCIGNITWTIPIPYTSGSADHHDSPIELQHLAYLMKEAMESFNNHGMDVLRSGTKEHVFESQKALKKLLSTGEDIEFFTFSSWLNVMRFQALDFGWGVPCSHHVPGVVGTAPFFNLILLNETRENKAVEAWITLKEATMAKLERDPQFLAYASPNL